MKMLWCWRCKSEMPMLDEIEYEQVHSLYQKAFASGGASREERFRPVCDLYERMTGLSESNPNAIMHHRISIYGEACANCGKQLRTPQAAFCAACGEQGDASDPNKPYRNGLAEIVACNDLDCSVKYVDVKGSVES